MGPRPSHTSKSRTGKRLASLISVRGRRQRARRQAGPEGRHVHLLLRASRLRHGARAVLAALALGDRSPDRARQCWPCSLAINVLDFLHLKHGAMSEFTPLKALTEVLLATATFALFGAAFGAHGGAFLLLPCLPFLTTALMGNPVMIGWRMAGPSRVAQRRDNSSVAGL